MRFCTIRPHEQRINSTVLSDPLITSAATVFAIPLVSPLPATLRGPCAKAHGSASPSPQHLVQRLCSCVPRHIPIKPMPFSSIIEKQLPLLMAYLYDCIR